MVCDLGELVTGAVVEVRDLGAVAADDLAIFERSVRMPAGVRRDDVLVECTCGGIIAVRHGGGVSLVCDRGLLVTRAVVRVRLLAAVAADVLAILERAVRVPAGVRRHLAGRIVVLGLSGIGL